MAHQKKAPLAGGTICSDRGSIPGFQFASKKKERCDPSKNVYRCP